MFICIISEMIYEEEGRDQALRTSGNQLSQRNGAKTCPTGG